MAEPLSPVQAGVAAKVVHEAEPRQHRLEAVPSLSHGQLCTLAAAGLEEPLLRRPAS